MKISDNLAIFEFLIKVRSFLDMYVESCNLRR